MPEPKPDRELADESADAGPELDLHVNGGDPIEEPVDEEGDDF